MKSTPLYLVTSATNLVTRCVAAGARSITLSRERESGPHHEKQSKKTQANPPVPVGTCSSHIRPGALDRDLSWAKAELGDGAISRHIGGRAASRLHLGLARAGTSSQGANRFIAPL